MTCHHPHDHQNDHCTPYLGPVLPQHMTAAEDGQTVCTWSISWSGSSPSCKSTCVQSTHTYSVQQFCCPSVQWQHIALCTWHQQHEQHPEKQDQLLALPSLFWYLLSSPPSFRPHTFHLLDDPTANWLCPSPPPSLFSCSPCVCAGFETAGVWRLTRRYRPCAAAATAPPSSWPVLIAQYKPSPLMPPRCVCWFRAA